MNYKPECYNCLNWYRNIRAYHGTEMIGEHDCCCGGFHNSLKKNGPSKDGVYSGECETFRTGPHFSCKHHKFAGWDVVEKAEAKEGKIK